MQENNWNEPYGYHEPERKGFAIASMVLGILSLVLCCVYGGFLGIPGLIFGIVSLTKKESGMGMAVAGIITSSIGMVYGILMVMATVLSIQYGTQWLDDEELLQRVGEMYGIEVVPESNAAAERVERTEETEDTGDTEDMSEEDPFAGKSFVMGDESVIYFETDGTFIWYQNDEYHDDNYFVGTYDCYRAELAESYIVTYLGEYGVTEDELADLYKRNENSDLYADKNFTCLVLHNESAICDGEEQLKEPYDSNYMGFYMDGYYDAVNMASGQYAAFTAR